VKKPPKQLEVTERESHQGKTAVHPWLPAPPSVEIREEEIVQRQVFVDKYEELLNELTCADLVRNYSEFLRETKKATLEAVGEHMRRKRIIDLQMLRDRHGFYFLTTLPCVDAAAFYGAGEPI